jgi:hypothetical protein
MVPLSQVPRVSSYSDQGCEVASARGVISTAIRNEKRRDGFIAREG